MYHSVKIYSIAILICCVSYATKAQPILFSETFEDRQLDSSWQLVSGKWHIADVQDKRIAPAEDGRQYVLSSGGGGYIYLFVDIPDSVKARQVKLSFSYYTYPGGPAPIVELDFYKKGYKDGHKGRKWKSSLSVKGRWVMFSKTFLIPKEGNRVWLTFYESPASSKTSKNVCFDNITLTAKL